MRYFLFFITALFTLVTLTAQVNAEGFYKWKDARGNTQYGDEPPTNVKAKRMKMPAITVLQDYGTQWEYEEDPIPVATKRATAPVHKIAVPITTAAPIQYSTLAFIAPKAGQLIRAEDGDVSAMISVKPPLRRGHKLHFILDGKNAVQSTSRVANFPNLSNGTHTLSVNIVTNSGDILQSSDTMNFRVTR